MKIILETARLQLREMLPEDLDFVAEMLADPEVMRFYPKCFTREESQQWIERQRARYQKYGHGLWLVQDRQTREPVGQVGLLTQEVDGLFEPEIGYLVHRPFWRQGFATEAALSVRSFAFDSIRLSRVISLIRPDNIPSQGVARKMSMKPERMTTFFGFPHMIWSVRRTEV